MHVCHTRSERFSSPSATYENSTDIHFHTRSERLSSPISTYENSTDIHFRSEYECSSLVKDLDCALRTDFYDAMQNYQHVHATRDVTIWAHLFPPTETVQTLTCGQNVNARVSQKILDCVLPIDFCDAMQKYQYMHATRDLNVWARLFPPTNTVQTLVFGQNMNARVS